MLYNSQLQIGKMLYKSPIQIDKLLYNSTAQKSNYAVGVLIIPYYEILVEDQTFRQ